MRHRIEMRRTPKNPPKFFLYPKSLFNFSVTRIKGILFPKYSEDQNSHHTITFVIVSSDTSFMICILLPLKEKKKDCDL